MVFFIKFFRLLAIQYFSGVLGGVLGVGSREPESEFCPTHLQWDGIVGINLLAILMKI